ncbi:unnamed protein product [Linum tenue]|uniref:Haloacid dehalogenase-like hydrolase family protein n=1 Tax=Linum tenue TaxID=586396 RepID=A0AAV0JHZ1_9ROSI|nr:unnamed protein product [Linum tenue]
MLPRVRPLLRFSLPLPPPMAPPISSRAAAATLPIVSLAAAPHSPSAFKSNIPSTAFAPPAFFTTRCFHAGVVKKIVPGVCAAAAGGQREYRKVRRRATAKSKQKELELSVSICIEEDLPDNDSEILSIAELLRLNVPMALKLALDGLKDSRCKTRDTTISDVGGYESIELSVMLCNDSFIRKLNKEWRGEDSATDVLSMSQHVPRLNLPILMLGDIVISVETAARQAEERGHTLLDEILILMVHGLLHLLGFDHEISDEAETEMEKEEEILLKSLGWTGKGLIQSAYDSCEKANSDSAILGDRKKEGSLRFYKPKFKYIFCDMDGTLLNSKSQLSTTNANALKEAMSRGVKVVIATGKARPAVINILKTAGLADKDGIVLEASPGVFLQGLLVYGRQGREIFRRNLDPGVCREVCRYSLEQKVPLIAFSNDRCLTLFDHPLVESLHTVYRAPQAEVMPSVEDLIAAADIQKMLFIDTADRVATELRPYWSEAAGELANVVQAVPHMLEIVPVGTSKGSGIQILLDHLGVKAEEIMAIGDGENDIEMLQLAALGIALSNGVEKTKAVADVIGVSNDEDGVADAIYRYAF